MKRACTQFWDEVFTGRFHIEVEGWHLAFFNDCCELDYCDQCISPDGRRWSFESVVRDGVEPFFCWTPRNRLCWSGFFNNCEPCSTLSPPFARSALKLTKHACQFNRHRDYSIISQKSMVTRITYCFLRITSAIGRFTLRPRPCRL